MKIATWNLQRPSKTSKRTEAIFTILKALQADILVLTETNDGMDLGPAYSVYHSAILGDPMYKSGERRVSIFSKYPLADTSRAFETFDAETALCVNFKTPIGELAVYGTIVGVKGNKGAQFKDDLEKQLLDFEAIRKQTSHFCIAGDLNISFSDNYYFTHVGRAKLNAAFEQHQMNNCTANLRHNIDHIVLSEKFVGDRTVVVSYWNETENNPNRLSDHKGVMVEILEGWGALN
ncbi:MAG: endonuclease/exonuclease/phosphatase family protein [Saprospiraceae bacterium]|nr:endonuclease/exonuclease/phosphatase family protein [Saprospiraceae bacterium]